jgi:hypothetical protein
MAQKWDLFDVHSGLVSMEVYLKQRHSEDDLKTVVEIPAEKWIEFVKPPPPPPEPPPRRPGPEFVIQDAEPEEPDMEDLLQNFHKAARDWEERNQ